MSIDKHHFNLYDIVTKIIGRVNPAGNESIDDERKENLIKQIELLDMLMDDLLENIKYKDDYRQSMKSIGMKSYEELKRINLYLSEFIEEESE